MEVVLLCSDSLAWHYGVAAAGSQLAEEVAALESLSSLIGGQRLHELARHEDRTQQLQGNVLNLQDRCSALERLCTLIGVQLSYTSRSAEAVQAELVSEIRRAQVRAPFLAALVALFIVYADS